MKIIKGYFKTIDVKDAKNSKEFNDDGKYLEIFILYYFMYFALSYFFSKILFKRCFAYTEIFDLILSI
jgi:hypothetical protein